MRRIIFNKLCVSFFVLALLLLNKAVLCGNSFGLDAHQVYFASDSGATFCRDTSSGPDLYLQSLFSRLKAAPPLGLTILPDRDLPSEGPCRNSKPNISGVGGLKILDWNTACKDAAGNGMCNWSCDACPTTGNCTIYKNHVNPFEQEADWCCCASRRACLDQSDAKYIILELVANDLWQVYNFYNRDVDRVVDQAKSLTTYLTGQGRTVIWLSYCPLAYGSLGGGEKSCSNWTSCLYAINSNVEYFYSKFIPWMNTQQNVHLIDFFSYVKATYGANANFINQYGFDGIHLKPGGHQIYYNYVYAELTQILGNTTTSTSSIVTTTTLVSTTTVQSTTTCTVPPACCAETIYGENAEETELLRKYRDNVLSNTPEGQEIIKAYYKFSPTVTKLLEQRPLIKEQG